MDLDFNLVSHTTYVVGALVLYIKLEYVSELQFSEKLFLATVFTLRLYVRNLLRVSRQRNSFSYFVMLKMPELGFEP